jgi:drug/metabolite transporter (DMT)-like permease
MRIEIVLALAASLFTATSSVAQRVAAAPAPGELSFSWRLILFLLKRPIWFFGILCMLGGFAFQLAALHVGNLSLVQPLIATEVIFVFGYLAVRNRNRVHARDWLAAFGMATGLGAFLFLASPSGGSTETSGWTWMLAGVAVAASAAIAAGVAYVPFGRDRPPTSTRKAAMLSVSAAIVWGFVAAVIKELGVHVSAGPAAVFSNWSPYVLLGAGAIGFFLASNAFQAGSLAASQPGLTIVDPLVASLLGVTIFSEHIRHTPADILGEGLALLVLGCSVVLLSQSSLIKDAPDQLEVAKVDQSPAGPAASAGESVVFEPPATSVGRAHRLPAAWQALRMRERPSRSL